MATKRTGKSPARPRQGGAGRKPSRAVPRRAGLLARLATALPFTEPQLRRAMTWGIVGGCGVAALAAASYAGVPAMANEHLAHVALQAGFKVSRVEVTGVDRLDKLKVYDLVLAENDRAMPLVDVARIRRDLLSYGWVKDARVTRRLPDTLVVDITERTPAAVWSRGGKLSLIDDGGQELQRIDPAHRPDLPLLIGADANRRTRELARLLEAAPALKPRIVAASWIGNRRWDLQFRSGETLALPEGSSLAAEALSNFARMDGISGLLGKQTTRFDMRDPDRAYFRRATPIAPDEPAKPEKS